MNHIQDYIQKRLAQSTKNETVHDILLGCHPADIIHFITWKELLTDPLPNIETVKKIMQKQKVKLIINGNLSDTLIQVFMGTAIKLKKVFSIVVLDGFRTLKRDMKQNKGIAILLTSLEGESHD